MNFGGFPVFPPVLPDNLVVSDGTAVTVDNVPSYVNSSGLLIHDSGSKMSDKLNKNGSNAMTGILDMGNNDIKNTDDVYPNTTGVSDLGKTAKRYRDVYVDDLHGPTKTRVIDTLVVGPSVAVDNNLVSFDGITGTNIQDSGLSALTIVEGPASAINGNVPLFDGISGKLLEDGGLVSANIVTSVASSTAGNLCSFTDNLGRIIEDSKIVSADLVTSSSTSVTDNIVLFSDNTGKVIKDSTVSLASKLSVDGSLPMTGNLDCDTFQCFVASDQPTTAGKFVVNVPDLTITGTTAETSIFSGGVSTFKGSRTWAANSTSGGFTVRFRGALYIGYLDTGNSFTLRIKNSDGTLLTQVYGPGLLLNQVIFVDAETSVRGDTGAITTCRIYRDGEPIAQAGGSASWNYGVSQTYDVTIELASAVADQVGLTTAGIESVFQGMP